MDKSDLILDKLNSMEMALRSEVKRSEENLTNKIDSLAVKTDMTWVAVKELRDDKTDINELRKRIEIMEKKLEKVG